MLVLVLGVVGAVLFRSEVPPVESETPDEAESSRIVHRSPEPASAPAATPTVEKVESPRPAPTTPPDSASLSAARPAPQLLGRIEEVAPTDMSAPAPRMEQRFRPFDADASSAGGAPAEQTLRPAPYAPRVGQAPSRTHKIADGDTLYYIAERYLGSGERYMEIFHANRDVMTDPDILVIGRELRIPTGDEAWMPDRSTLQAEQSSSAAPLAPIPPGSLARQQTPAQPTANATSGRTFRVRANDTLAEIAREVYGDARRHVDIYQANRDRLRGPEDLREGMVLVIP